MTKLNPEKGDVIYVTGKCYYEKILVADPGHKGATPQTTVLPNKQISVIPESVLYGKGDEKGTTDNFEDSIKVLEAYGVRINNANDSIPGKHIKPASTKITEDIPILNADQEPWDGRRIGNESVVKVRVLTGYNEKGIPTGLQVIDFVESNLGGEDPDNDLDAAFRRATTSSSVSVETTETNSGDVPF